MVRKELVLLSLCLATGYQMSYEAGDLFENNVKDDEFGKVVSISGDVLIVGAPGEDQDGEDAGAVYVYKLTTNVWTLDARIIPSDIAAGDRFGNAVKVTGNHIIVGADGHDDGGLADTGSAYIFRKNADSWVEEAKLLGNDTMAGDKFGISVGISESYAVVGADWHTGPAGVGSGAAYVFYLDGSDGTWKQEAQLLASDAESLDRFGGTIDISDTTVIVGALESEENGAAYIFQRSEVNGVGIWNEVVKWVADADSNSTDTDRFGSAVAVSGDTAVVGAFWDDGVKVNGGAAYIYTWNTSAWSSGTKIYAPDGATEEDRFGISVDVSGNTLIVGAYFDSDSGLWSGSAYIFARLSNDQWSYQEKLGWSQAAAAHFFGRGVSIWDSNVGPFTAVVGAPGANRSIVLEGGLPTTSTTTTKTTSTTSTRTLTITTSSSVSSSTTESSTSTTSSSTSLTSITQTSTSLTTSSTSITVTSSTSSTKTMTTSTSSSATLTTSTATTTTKTTATSTTLSTTTTSLTTTSETETSVTSSSISSTITSLTGTQTSTATSTETLTFTATSTLTTTTMVGGSDGDGASNGEGDTGDNAGDDGGDAGDAGNDGGDGGDTGNDGGDDGGNGGDTGNDGGDGDGGRGNSSDTDGGRGNSSDTDGDGETVTVKEDFGSGVDPFGSWTWEEFESASFRPSVTLVFLLSYVHWN